MTKVIPTDNSAMPSTGSLQRVDFVWSCFLAVWLFILNRVVEFDVIDIIFYTYSFCRNILVIIIVIIIIIIIITIIIITLEATNWTISKSYSWFLFSSTSYIFETLLAPTE